MTPIDNNSIQSFIAQLPKVELHVHLEGSIDPELWLRLIQRNDPSQENLTVKELNNRLQFQSFNDFVQVFIQVINSLQKAEDFYHLTLQHLKKSADQNIRHSETMLTPCFFTSSGIPFDDMMSEIARAAKEAEKRWGITLNLIFDGPRNFGPAVVREVFEMAASDKTGLVVGVGIGGDEKNFPAKWFKNEFDYARSQGLKAIVHAGETDGQQSILDAITILRAHRIGHALGIKPNSILEEIILKKQITLDLCPWSNVATNSVTSLMEHPFMDYYNRGYKITLNSDDPSLFKTSLNQEFESLATLHNLSPLQLSNLCLMAVQAAFIPVTTQNQIAAEIQQYLKKWESATGTGIS